jgi:hypothetical protein
MNPQPNMTLTTIRRKVNRLENEVSSLTGGAQPLISIDSKRHEDFEAKYELLVYATPEHKRRLRQHKIKFDLQN